MKLQIAMNIIYDLMIQCLLCLRNARDQTTLLICQQMIAVKRFHRFLVITIRLNAMSEI